MHPLWMERRSDRRAGGKKRCRERTAVIQGNPNGRTPPRNGPEEPQPLQGAPGRGLGDELEGPLQPTQRRGSSAHSPTRLSWKKSNGSAPAQMGALQDLPRAGAQRVELLKGGSPSTPQGLNRSPTLSIVAPRSQITHPEWDPTRKVSRNPCALSPGLGDAATSGILDWGGVGGSLAQCPPHRGQRNWGSSRGPKRCQPS